MKSMIQLEKSYMKDSSNKVNKSTKPTISYNEVLSKFANPADKSAHKNMLSEQFLREHGELSRKQSEKI